MDCIFCSIVEKKIPASVVYENDKVLAFKDINPAAVTHILFIPKEHIARLDDIEPDNASIMQDLYSAILQFANEHNMKEAGFKTKIHVGAGGGQEVFHLHIHLLSNKKLDV